MKYNECWLQHTKGKVKTDSCEIFAQSCEMLRKTKSVLMHSLFRTIVRTCWGLCETVFSPDSLVKKPLEDLLDDAKCPLDLGL